MRRAAAVGLVGLGSFLLFRSTLLPGLDLGDTASFQTIVGTPVLTPRQGYPLYYALGNTLLFLTRLPPAFAMNLMSALTGALAAVALCWAINHLTRSALAGMFGGFLFVSSYTFWSQAVIAEVYALHALFIALCLKLVLVWRDRRTMSSLAAFFACFALSFGNHLSMILMFPGFAVFVLCEGGRTVLRGKVLLLALTLAILGALQYAWNLASIWDAPGMTWLDKTASFWADVTKADWRESMVLRVPSERIADRLRMGWFDIQQQFGLFGIVAGIVGCAWLVRRDFNAGLMLVMMYVASAVFALTYNVGDTHVFFIPAHLVVAAFAGCAFQAGRLTLNARPLQRPIFASLFTVFAFGYVAWRIWDTYPSLDRSTDTRAQSVLERLTRGLGHDVFAPDLNWQLLNGLDYYTEYIRPEIGFVRFDEVFPRFGRFVTANVVAGRRVAVTGAAVRRLNAAYGDVLPVERDSRVPPPPRLADVVSSLPAGTAYVFCWLQPLREYRVDSQVLGEATARLYGAVPPTDRYAVILGRVGERPVLVRESQRPFRASMRLDSLRFDIRVESWLPTDTIRRAGFGHVIVNRHNVLIMERGSSFVALDDRGRPQITHYGHGILEPQERYLVGQPVVLARRMTRREGRR